MESLDATSWVDEAPAGGLPTAARGCPCCAQMRRELASLRGIHDRTRTKLQAARKETRWWQRTARAAQKRECKAQREAAAEIARLWRKNARLEGQRDRLQERLAKQAVRIGKLRVERDELKRRLASVKARLKGQIERLKERLAKRAVQLRKLRAQCQKLKNRLAVVKASRGAQARRLFGRSSEKQERPPTGRNRGAQPGAPGHGRTARPNLEVREEVRDPPADQQECKTCGKPYVRNGSRSTDIYEIKVTVHVHRVTNNRMRRTCECPGTPMVIAPPPVPRVFPNTPYGCSVWGQYLHGHFVHNLPVQQMARMLEDMGLPVSAGTLCGGDKQFEKLFAPLQAEILAHLVEAPVWHIDETSWRVEEWRRRGCGQKAWQWIAASNDAACFHIDANRSTEAARRLLGGSAGGGDPGDDEEGDGTPRVVVCDGYSVYGKLARDSDLVLQHCWAHIRRAFKDCIVGDDPAHAAWQVQWLGRISKLYDLYKKRAGQAPDSPAYEQTHEALVEHLDVMCAAAEKERDALSKEHVRYKPLNRMLKQWSGLCVFLDRPEVAIDNNLAERLLRPSVIGRKLSFGSDSEGGARFTAMMRTVMGTMRINSIDEMRWLNGWLTACAANGGKPPDDLAPWLPWSMDAERRKELSVPGA